MFRKHIFVRNVMMFQILQSQVRVGMQRPPAARSFDDIPSLVQYSSGPAYIGSPTTLPLTLTTVWIG